MNVPVARFEIPRFAPIKVRFCKGDELRLRPALRSIRSNVDCALGHGVEKCLSVRLGGGHMPGVNELIHVAWESLPVA